MNGGSAVPWSREAEVSVLGAMLIDSGARAFAAEHLEVEDLYREANRRVFDALTRLNGQGADVVMLSDELKASGELEAVGGMGYLAQLVDAVPTATQIEHHVRVVRAKATLRRLQEAARAVEQDAASAGSREVAETVARARERLRQVEDRAGADLDDQRYDLADVLSDPSGLTLPEPLLPGVAVPRHFMLWTGPPKVGGKTAFLTAGAGAVATGGFFLGRSVPQGTVLWIMGEGSELHLGRYLAQVGVYPPPGSFVAIRSGANPLGQLVRAVDLHEPDLLVIDSLGSWTAPMDVDLHTPEVARPLKRVEDVARDGPAAVMIHWGRKSDGDPAGHHTIKAIPDAIRTIEEGEIERERVVKGAGRWHLPTLRYRMEVLGDHPEISDLQRVEFIEVDPDRALEERIMDFLEEHPDASKSKILEGIDGARRTKKVEALDELKRAGIVKVDTSGRAHTHRIAQTPHGHGTATVSDGPGHGGTGTGGDTVAEGGSLFPKEENPSATVEAEPVDEKSLQDDLDNLIKREEEVAP